MIDVFVPQIQTKVLVLYHVRRIRSSDIVSCHRMNTLRKCKIKKNKMVFTLHVSVYLSNHRPWCLSIKRTNHKPRFLAVGVVRVPPITASQVSAGSLLSCFCASEARFWCQRPCCCTFCNCCASERVSRFQSMDWIWVRTCTLMTMTIVVSFKQDYCIVSYHTSTYLQVSQYRRRDLECLMGGQTMDGDVQCTSRSPVPFQSAASDWASRGLITSCRHVVRPYKCSVNTFRAGDQWRQGT
jgi:hypothetical protein